MPQPSGGGRPLCKQRRSNDGASWPSNDIASKFGIVRDDRTSARGPPTFFWMEKFGWRGPPLLNLRLHLRRRGAVPEQLAADLVADLLRLVDDVCQHLVHRARHR